VKLRVRATKIGKVRFTSHRDAARMWERALRRAGLPVAFTEGFTPRPKISFGLALPTGAESIAEYVDIELQRNVAAADVDLETLPALLSEALPNGFDVLAAGEREQGATSLQEAVTSCTWELWSPLLSAEDHLDACRLLESAELVLERERKGKRSADDVRPMILDLRPDPTGDRLIAELVTIGRALRPGELAELAYPNIDARDVRALRTHQWLDHDGTRREVLPLPADVDARTLAVLA
jgi:radical SAM-linked protein